MDYIPLCFTKSLMKNFMKKFDCLARLLISAILRVWLIEFFLLDTLQSFQTNLISYYLSSSNLNKFSRERENFAFLFCNSLLNETMYVNSLKRVQYNNKICSKAEQKALVTHTKD